MMRNRIREPTDPPRQLCCQTIGVGLLVIADRCSHDLQTGRPPSHISRPAARLRSRSLRTMAFTRLAAARRSPEKQDPDLLTATEVIQRWGTRTSQPFDKPKCPNCEKRQKEDSSAREEGCRKACRHDVLQQLRVLSLSVFASLQQLAGGDGSSLSMTRWR